MSHAFSVARGKRERGEGGMYMRIVVYPSCHVLQVLLRTPSDQEPRCKNALHLVSWAKNRNLRESGSYKEVVRLLVTKASLAFAYVCMCIPPWDFPPTVVLSYACSAWLPGYTR